MRKQFVIDGLAAAKDLGGCKIKTMSLQQLDYLEEEVVINSSWFNRTDIIALIKLVRELEAKVARLETDLQLYASELRITPVPDGKMTTSMHEQLCKTSVQMMTNKQLAQMRRSSLTNSNMLASVVSEQRRRGLLVAEWAGAGYEPELKKKVSDYDDV